jgi:UDP-N-acetylmuramyl pentapeptide phosphotransferase/UDP-N-acetylglucosamine-1-phosphate transferase
VAAQAATAATIAVAAAGAARAAYWMLGRQLGQKPSPGGSKTWTRTNHRGEPVTLLEGPAIAAGAVGAALAASAAGAIGPREAAALALAGAGSAAFGCYDDLAGSSSRRGLRGHLGALRHGEVTTGAVKLAGIGVTGLVSAAAISGSAQDVVLNAGLIAGGANLLNLFDLRPGRAIKVAVASSALIEAGAPHAAGLLAAPAGAALALLPEDLGERAMLGDTGANALGAMLGTAAACTLPLPARIALLAGIVAFTGASEKISFTKVIARTPPLHWLDMLGRRPAAPASAPASAPAAPAPAAPAPAAPAVAAPDQ